MNTPLPPATASTAQAYRSAAKATRAELAGTLLVIGAAVCFSAKPVLVKLVYQSAGAHNVAVEPIAVMAARLMFSAPLFAAIALWSNRPGRQALHRRDWARVVGLALTGYYFSQLLDTTALMYISAGLERVVLFAYPTLVVLISAAALGTRIRAGTGAALALTWSGVALAVSDQAGTGAARPEATFGVALVLCAAFTFAVYSVGSASLIRSMGATRFTALAMCGSSLAVGIHFGLSGATSPLSLPAESLAWSAVMALFATVLPAFMFSAGVARVGASRAAILSTVGPVATLGLDAVALDQPVTAVHVAGTALVLAGVTVVGRARK